MKQRQRTFAAIAAAGLLLHFLVLVTMTGTPTGSLFSNLLQFALGLLVVAATLDAANRSGRFGGDIWRMVATSFAIYTIGQGVVIYYDNVRADWWFSTPLLYFWIIPLLVSVIVDPGEDRRRVNINLALDTTQVVLLAVAVYMVVFSLNSQFAPPPSEALWLKFKFRIGRDALVLAALLLRTSLAEFRLSRRLFGRLALFFGLYAVADISYIYLEVAKGLRSGTMMDLAWSVPRVLLIALALTWDQRDESEILLGQNRRRRGYLMHASALIVPIMMLFLTDELRRERPVFGYTITTLVLVLAGVRLLQTQRERERVVQDLFKTNQLFSTVLNGVNEAIYIRDPQGRYVMMNDTGVRMMQRPREEVIGKRDADLMDPVTAAEIERSDREVMETGQPYVIEEEFYVRGTPMLLLVTKDVYRGASGEVLGVLGVAVDLTERRRLEAQLHQSQKMESIGTLSGGLAHDFNNLLTVILGYGDMLLERPLDPDTKDGLRQIHGAAERAAALTRQLLAFSRKQVLQPRVVAINEIIKNLEPLMTRLIGEDIQIRLNLAKDLGFIEVDPGQMDQVFMNLAANARDAMPKGGLLTIVTANVRISESDASELDLAPGDYVEICFSDTGTGIPHDLQHRVFEPFFTTKEVGRGTGLGLSTVYGIVKQSGGQLTLFSVPGQGTAFHFYFPRANRTQRKEFLSPARELAAGSETILLVEDNDQVRNLARESLEKNGYTVLAASTPEMAQTLESEFRGEIALLLTDLVMPGTNGEALAEVMQQRRPSLRVIYMSGYAPETVLTKQESPIRFVSKPFTSPVLLRTVRNALDGKPIA